jgi:hypothetical protein
MLALLLSACAPEVVQTPACAEFVACVEATDVTRSTSTDVVRFQPDGDCWGSAAGADLCDHACSNGLTFHKARFPDVCAP